jgi:hypothetical protein
MLVKLSSRDDLPELWSPTTTSYKFVSPKQENADILGGETYLWQWNMFTDVPLTEFIDLTQQSWVG